MKNYWKDTIAEAPNICIALIGEMTKTVSNFKPLEGSSYGTFITYMYGRCSENAKLRKAMSPAGNATISIRGPDKKVVLNCNPDAL